MLAKDYRNAEVKLLDVLLEMHKRDAFVPLGYTGIFNYGVGALGLGEAQASYFARVVKRAREVPELKAAIDEGTLTVSQARRIVPVVTRQNSEEWIAKAAILSQRELEREVSRVNPKAARETICPIGPAMSELRVGISLELEQKIQRLRDFLSQKLQKPATIGDVLEVIAEEYLHRHDPIRKAARASLRKAKPIPTAKQGRTPYPASLRHALVRRDGNQCTFVDAKGRRCTEQRWLHFHHRVPLVYGGANDLDNLTTLCSAHHRSVHGGGAAVEREESK